MTHVAFVNNSATTFPSVGPVGDRSYPFIVTDDFDMAIRLNAAMQKWLIQTAGNEPIFLGSQSARPDNVNLHYIVFENESAAQRALQQFTGETAPERGRAAPKIRRIDINQSFDSSASLSAFLLERIQHDAAYEAGNNLPGMINRFTEQSAGIKRTG